MDIKNNKINVTNSENDKLNFLNIKTTLRLKDTLQFSASPAFVKLEVEKQTKYSKLSLTAVYFSKTYCGQ